MINKKKKMWNSVRQRKQAPNIGPKPTPTTRPFPLISNLQPMEAQGHGVLQNRGPYIWTAQT